MSIVVNLTPAEESRLSAEAEKNGLAPEELARKLLSENLPPTKPKIDIDKHLRELQAQDRVKLMPSRTLDELEAQWAKEDEGMTDEERLAEEQLWEDFIKGINETRAALGMRLL